MPDKVLIIGAGAIGGFYGGLLAKAGADVAVVCRSDFDVVRTQGYRIISRDLGEWCFMPTQVLRDARDYLGEADYVILTSKVTADIDRVELVQPALASRSTLVFIQNGVEIEQAMLSAFPDHEVVSGLAYICCNRWQPGILSHLAYGKLTLGNLPGGVSAKSRHLQDLFLQSGIECAVSDDIIASRWQKCVWNAPFNPLSVLSGGLATETLLQTQEDFIRRIMQEVCDIAAACGHALPDDAIEINIANTRAMPPYKTSMLLDFERGHPLETEAILGNAVRAGQREGVRCPNLQALYSLMQLRELQTRSGQSKN